MLDVLLNVLAVIGIIVVGGFVVVFLGNLLLSALDSSSKSRKDDNFPQQPTYYDQPQQITYAPVQQPVVMQEPVKQVGYDEVDFKKAQEEEAALNGKAQQLNEEYAKLEQEKEALRQEKLRFEEEKNKAQEQKVEEKIEEPVEDDEDEEINLDDIFFDDEDEEIINSLENESTAEEKVEEEPVEEQIEESVEEVEEPAEEEIAEEPVEEDATEPAEDENLARIKELEEMLANKQAELDNKNSELESKDAEVEQLKKQASEVASAPVVEKSDANLTLEEYEQRLEILNQRLKLNEKELKNVKKEYLPLAKVKKSLEKDKKKLRRREALVAKQKVVLYGVNNYGDIDEEKAKKLAEDLDLLDGLKVSVAHCEEVLKENQERYPVLENSYNILTENTNALKQDILECQAKIDELKAKKD